RFLEWKRLVWVGRLSYGLYLWHVPALAGLFSFGIVATFEYLTTLVYEDFPFFRLALAFAIASLSYYYVEQPFLRMKQRFIQEGNVGIKSKQESAKGVPSDELLITGG